MESNKNQQGTTIIMLLVFMIIAITVISSSIMLSLGNSFSTMKIEQGTVAAQLAESGLENGILRLLRDPTYTGETFSPATNQTVVITVSGSTTKIITSTATIGSFQRSFQADIQIQNGTYIITAYKEIF